MRRGGCGRFSCIHALHPKTSTAEKQFLLEEKHFARWRVFKRGMPDAAAAQQISATSFTVRLLSEKINFVNDVR
jgi:hypothetical protein